MARRKFNLTLFKPNTENIALAAMRRGKSPTKLMTDAGLSALTAANVMKGKLLRPDTVFKIARAAGVEDPAELITEVVEYGKAKDD